MLLYTGRPSQKDSNTLRDPPREKVVACGKWGSYLVDTGDSSLVMSAGSRKSRQKATLQCCWKYAVSATPGRAADAEGVAGTCVHRRGRVSTTLASSSRPGGQVMPRQPGSKGREQLKQARPQLL